MESTEMTWMQPPIFKDHDEYEEAHYFAVIMTYFSFLTLASMGHINDFLRKFLPFMCVSLSNEKGNVGFVPLYSDFEAFFTRNFYRRIGDCWNRPLTGNPGKYCTVLERRSDDENWTFRTTGKTIKCLNLGSYNYLGFADLEPAEDACGSSSAKEEKSADREFVAECITRYGVSPGGSTMEGGNYALLNELELEVARFVGKERAMVVGMGFATNSTIIPSLVSAGCLVLSDSLNHTSLIMGCRLSGATIKVFKHNDMANLEFLLQNAILRGQPVKSNVRHKPWRKILIIVEGIYSMEGAIVKLRDIVALKNKYSAYLYVDEAHSVGALGKTGRGVCEYWAVDPGEVDILMGTFTKSFGAAGGYAAGNADVIETMRHHSHHTYYATAMSAPVAAQILRVLKLMDEPIGRQRIAALHRNTRYFRQRLTELGFIIYGDDNSPVVPMLMYFPGAMQNFSRRLLRENIAVVVVGYPATPLLSARARFCLNGAHTIQEIDYALTHIAAIGDLLGVNFKKGRKLVRN